MAGTRPLECFEKRVDAAVSVDRVQRLEIRRLNADVMQRDELRNPSPEASYEAARIASLRRAEHIAQRRDFVTEANWIARSPFCAFHDRWLIGRCQFAVQLLVVKY